jgi:hypothetical protein
MTDTDDTVTTPGAATSTAGGASLADWLAARSDAHLIALLRARPDLAVPPPATIVVLAGRAEQRASVARAADNLTSLEFGILELLALDKADEMPVSRATLLGAVGTRVNKKTVDATLDTLRSLALVWGDADNLRIVPAVVATIPWRVGRIAEPTETNATSSRRSLAPRPSVGRGTRPRERLPIGPCSAFSPQDSCAGSTKRRWSCRSRCVRSCAVKPLSTPPP